MKKIGVLGVIILIVMIISMTNVSVVAVARASNNYILHDGVNLYADETLTTVTKELNQNDQVEVLEVVQIGGAEFYKVKHEGDTGYVDAKYLYSTSRESRYKLYTAKAYSDHVGGSIEVYSSPSAEKNVIKTYLDGTVLTVSKSEVDGYHIVIMEDGVGYVKDENLTTSISYNERVALSIALICAIAIILILLITYYRRNYEYFKSKKTSK